jgi:hypothetical protein
MIYISLVYDYSVTQMGTRPIKKVLPQLIGLPNRVAKIACENRVHLFPFRSAGPGDELLHLAESQTYRRIQDIAHEAGFRFETHRAQFIMVDPQMPEPQAGFDMKAVFIRDSHSR